MKPSAKLLGEIAVSITGELPDGFGVDLTADQDFVFVHHSEQETIAGPFDDDFEESFEDYLFDFLSHLQDFIAEALHEPWPSDQMPMPAPYVMVTDQELRLGFGRSSDPLIELARLSVESSDPVD